jgi:hypothetical protein
MTGSQTLLARAALGVVAAFGSVLLVSFKPLQEWPRRSFDRIVIAALIVSRLGLFCVLFLWLGAAPRGDVPSFYLNQVQEVMQHKLPYRDFPSAYAPLHAYLDAGLFRLWHTPLALMLFPVFAELLLLPLWLRVGRAFLAESEVRAAALLYLASPISLQFVAVDGQDNVVIALLIVAALLQVVRGRTALSGAAIGLSIVTFKFLPLLYCPLFFLACLRRWRWAIGAAAVVLPVYGWLLFAHAPILQPLAAEGELRSAGDLPYLVEAVSGLTLPGRFWDLLLLLALLGLFAAVARAARDAPPAVCLRAITFGVCAVTLAVLLLSKKSWPPYLMLSLFQICLLPASGARSRLRITTFALFGVVAVTEHSVWASGFAQFSASEFHAALQQGSAPAWLFFILELLLLAGYACLLRGSVRLVLRSRQRVAPPVLDAPAPHGAISLTPP